MDTVRSADQTGAVAAQGWANHKKTGKHNGDALAVNRGTPMAFVGADRTSNLPTERETDEGQLDSRSGVENPGRRGQN